MENKIEQEIKTSEGSAGVDQSRRQAIAKLGAYAAFTVPAVTGLLVSKKASALTIIIGPNP